MSRKQLNEGLDYQDFKGMIEPEISVDEYSAKIGKDSDIVTITFIVNSKLAAEDLVSWLEVGYDYILDASVSDGELEPGKWLVFVEMNRRTSVPQRIVEILEDLETLTDMPVEKYKIKIDDKNYPAEEDVLKTAIILSPHEYRNVKEEEKALNEYREIAGLKNKNVFENIDKEIKDFITLANL